MESEQQPSKLWVCGSSPHTDVYIRVGMQVAQSGLTVNQVSFDFVCSNHTLPTLYTSGGMAYVAWDYGRKRNKQ